MGMPGGAKFETDLFTLEYTDSGEKTITLK